MNAADDMTAAGAPRIQRRTVAKGLAWAVPAVAVASAVPAYAAVSGTTTVTQTGPACKLPGGSCETETGIKWGYTQPVLICTTVPQDVTIDFDANQTIKINGVTTLITIVPDTLTIEYTGTGGQRCEPVYIYLSTKDSANSTLEGTITWSWSSEDGTASGTGTTDLYAPYTPPCDDCQPPTVSASPQASATPATEEQARTTVSSVETSPSETATPTPSPSATPTETATPTHTPTPSPSATPTETVTPTPSPSATPTA